MSNASRIEGLRQRANVAMISAMVSRWHGEQEQAAEYDRQRNELETKIREMEQELAENTANS